MTKRTRVTDDNMLFWPEDDTDVRIDNTNYHKCPSTDKTSGLIRYTPRDRVYAVATLTWIILITLLTLMVIFSGGCKSSKFVSPALNATGAAAARADVRFDLLQRYSDALGRKVPRVFRPTLKEMHEQASLGRKDMGVVEMKTAQAMGELNAATITAQTWHNRYEAERDRFFSAVQRKWGWIFGGFLVIGLIARACAKFAGLPIIISYTMMIFGKGMMCVSLIGILLLWIESEVSKRKAICKSLIVDPVLIDTITRG